MLHTLKPRMAKMESCSTPLSGSHLRLFPQRQPCPCCLSYRLPPRWLTTWDLLHCCPETLQYRYKPHRRLRLWREAGCSARVLTMEYEKSLGASMLLQQWRGGYITSKGGLAGMLLWGWGFHTLGSTYWSTRGFPQGSTGRTVVASCVKRPEGQGKAHCRLPPWTAVINRTFGVAVMSHDSNSTYT